MNILGLVFISIFIYGLLLIKYSFDLEQNLLEQDEIDKKIIDSLIKDSADKDDEYYKTFYM